MSVYVQEGQERRAAILHISRVLGGFASHSQGH